MLSQHTLNLHPTLSLRAVMATVFAYVLLMLSPTAYAEWIFPVNHDSCWTSESNYEYGCSWRYKTCDDYPSLKQCFDKLYSFEGQRGFVVKACPKHLPFFGGGHDDGTGYMDCYADCPAGTAPDAKNFCAPDCPLGQYHDGTACVPKPACPSGEHFDATAKQCACNDGYFRAPSGHRWETQCIRQATTEELTANPTWTEQAESFCSGTCLILTNGTVAEVIPSADGVPDWGSSIPLPGVDSGDPDGEDSSTTPGDTGSGGGGGSGTTGGGAGCKPITLPKGTNYFMVVPRLGAEKGC